MADALSGLLQGLNQGVQTGLSLYTAVEGQKRAQRQEDLQAARYAVEDQRYADTQERQASRDKVDDDHWDKTYQINKAKMDADAKRAQTKMEQDAKFKQADLDLRAKTAADASNRGWAQYGQSKRRNDLTEAKQTQTTYKGLVKDVGDAFADPDRGDQAGLDLLNNSPEHRLATVTKFQQMGLVGNVDPATVHRMTVVPAGEGQYAIGVVGDDGKVSAYDPDGPDGPQKAVTVPRSTLQRVLGGQAAVDAGDSKVALGLGQAAIGGTVSALNNRAQSLSGTIDTAKKDAEQAAFTKEFEETGPRAEFLRQQQASATAPDTWAGAGGTVVRTDPSTGKRVLDKVSNGQLQNSAYQTAKTEHQQALSAADATLQQAPRTVAAAEAEERNVTTRARSLAESNQLMTDRVRNLPVKDRVAAVQSATEIIDKDPMLYKMYPDAKNLKDATDQFTKDRNGFVDRIVSAVDVNTVPDAKGKMGALQGGKANLRAVLSSMPKEMQMALMDYTGQAEGAVQKAAQEAASMGKPEAIPYILYSDKLGVDSKSAVKLMQDPALASVKDPADRFKYAAQALELVSSGKASTPEAGLGKVLMSR